MEGCDRPRADNITDVWAGNLQTTGTRQSSQERKQDTDSGTLFWNIKWVGGNGDVTRGEKAALGVPVICVKGQHHLQSRACCFVWCEFIHGSVWRTHIFSLDLRFGLTKAFQQYLVCATPVTWWEILMRHLGCFSMNQKMIEVEVAPHWTSPVPLPLMHQNHLGTF